MSYVPRFLFALFTSLAIQTASRRATADPPVASNGTESAGPPPPLPHLPPSPIRQASTLPSITAQQALHPALFDSALLSNHFSFSQGFEYLQIKLPNWPTYKALGLSEKFTLGMRFHDRVGAYGKFEGGVLSGFSMDKNFFFDAGVLLKYEGGLSVVILKLPEVFTQLGGNVKVRGAKTNSANLDTNTLTIPPDVFLKFLQNGIGSNTGVKVADYVNFPVDQDTKRELFGGVSLNMINAFHKNIVLQSSLEVVGGKANYMPKPIWQTGIGVAGMIGASPYLPIAVQSEYFYMKPQVGQVTHSIYESISYGIGSNVHISLGIGKVFIPGQNILIGGLTGTYIFAIPPTTK